MKHDRLTGLIAATYTPFDDDGNLRLDQISVLVDHLITVGVSGLYVCGSTGEGMSMTNPERQMVTESFVRSAKGRVPVIVQVGHNSVRDARELASHAQNCGADVISATCPSYFKVSNVTDLVETMAEVAGGAPELPFYYYHIPSLTGSTIDMPEFLDRASRVIPNLVGLKYTDTKLFEYQSCLALNDGQFDIVWGCDEMLLGAWATGARGAIGSTYNIAAPWYLKLIDAFSQGDLQQSRHWQMKSVDMVRTLGAFPFHPAMKAILQMQGFDFGSCRSPLGRLSEDQVASLRQQAIRLGLVE